MPPMSGPYPSGQGTTPTPEAPSPDNARHQASDLAIRQRQLLQQCDTLAQQIQALGLIAPFAQDDLLQALSGLSSAKEKLITYLGQEVEQAQQGSLFSSPNKGQEAGSAQAQAPRSEGLANSY